LERQNREDRFVRTLGVKMDWFVSKLQSHPEVALFLTLAIGYAVGRIRIGSFQLGAVTGVLLAGVAVGQLNIPISSDLQSAFFLLFLFSIGYKVGPQFFAGLKKEGIPQLALTVLLCVTALLATFGFARLFHFDAGTAAGLAAGALTESATVGTATDAIRRLGRSAELTSALAANVASAFAVAYLVGVISVTWFLSSAAPRLMGVDLAAECERLETSMGQQRSNEPGVVSARRAFELRAFRLPPTFSGKTVSELESAFATRVFVGGIRRDRELVEALPTTRLAAGDVISVAARREVLVAGVAHIGTEVDDPELLDVLGGTIDVVVTNGAIAGQTLAKLAESDAARGVFVRTMLRAGQELPITPATVVERGDVITIVGLESQLKAAAAHLGYADPPTNATNMIAVGLAIFCGAVMGLPALRLGSLEIGLGTSVGALIGGLICGWLRATRRSFAQIPEAALWLFDSLGLTAFIAVVGMTAGPRFFKGLSEAGLELVIAGLCVALLPHLITVLVGHRLMKIHPGIVLGICAGAGTSAPALAAIQEKARSKIPTLGYGVPYAVGNVLLALWGTVIVFVLA
jgi:putative transport protein